MSASHRPIIIIKRPVQAAAHHGGGWKIAFADFMTAMMAFFLVMWLLSTSSPEQLAGIAGEFRMPLKVALAGGTKNNNNNSDSVIPGGGTDPTHAEGEVKMSSTDAESRDLQRQEDLKERLANMIEADPVLKLFRPQLLIDITPEGLRIQIVDSSNRPMFDRSSAIVMPYMRTILRAIGPVLNEQSNKITLSGHTDSTLYSQGDRSYSNWELSSDRANASRRELIAGGMLDTKVLRVMGVASSMPFSQEDPLAPVNRRISIVVLNKRAQAEIESANAVKAGLAVSPPANAQQQPASAPAPAGVQPAAPDTGRSN
jgi:chemotaxis protein MotB